MFYGLKSLSNGIRKRMLNEREILADAKRVLADNEHEIAKGEATHAAIISTRARLRIRLWDCEEDLNDPLHQAEHVVVREEMQKLNRQEDALVAGLEALRAKHRALEAKLAELEALPAE